MGLGKTSSSLLAVDTLLTAGLAEHPLVLAPLRVARTTWPDEAAKWRQLSHLRVQPIVGTQKQRHDALFHSKADVWTINYEQLPWLVNELNGVWPFDTVIADEATRLKSFRLQQGGKRAQVLRKVYPKINRFVELTGTPAPNGLADLWGQMWFIDQGQRLGRTYTAFTDRWFRPHESGYGIVPLPFAQKQIQEALKDVCLTLDPKDWFDLDEPIVSTVYVDLPKEAARHYREMEREMFTLIGDTEIEAFNAASRTIKCLQFASGAIYTSESCNEWEVIHDEKIEALKSIVEEAAGMPVLVAYQFQSDLRRLLAAFPSGRVLDTNPNTIRSWNRGDIPMLFAHPDSAGHGLNLQDGGNILVYFSHWWALESRQQILERIGPVRQKQAGHNRPTYVYNIVCKGTVDEDVIERIISKREVQDVLLEAMKRRG
jgi:SNF2 family DNA or RNA helicase